MRRSIIVALAVAIVTLALGLFSEGRISALAEGCQQGLYRVGESLNAEDWTRAQAQTTALLARWEKEIDAVQLWVNHEDACAVTRSLRGLLASLTLRDSLSSLLYYGECMENFAHLYHRDAFTLKNIL